MTNDSNIFWQTTKVKKKDRRELNGHQSFVLWFTGLSGAGKSTLATAVEHELFERKIHTYILDGDNVRHGLNKDMGFSDQDRVENIRRIGEVSKLMLDAGIVVLSAFISPFREDRQIVRSILERNEFIEIYVKCSLEVCEERDPKGLYKKARSGEIKDFTGIDSAYEDPENPEFVVETDVQSVEECVARILNFIDQRGLISL